MQFRNYLAGARESPAGTGSQARRVCGSSTRYIPSSVSGNCKQPLDRSGRSPTEAHTKYETATLGPVPNLEGPSPRATTLRTSRPLRFTFGGISAPRLRRVQTGFTGENQLAPGGSQRPFEQNRWNIRPQRNGRERSSAPRSSNRCTYCKKYIAEDSIAKFKARASQIGRHPREAPFLESKLQFPDKRKRARLPAAPVLRAITLASPMQRNWPRGPRVVEKGCRQMLLFSFRQKGSIALHTDGRPRRNRGVGALRLILHRVAPIGTVRRRAVSAFIRKATIANSRARIESVQGPNAPPNLILFFFLRSQPPLLFPCAFWPCGVLPMLRNRSLPPRTQQIPKLPKRLGERRLHMVQKADASVSQQQENPCCPEKA